MRLLAHLFVPGHHNSHHPHLLRHTGLSGFFYILLTITLIYNSLNPYSGHVLGFATEITADQVIALTNQQRSGNGLGSLTSNTQLALAAQAKAKYMFDHDFWAHNAPDGTTPWFFIDSQGYKYSAAGENLARDFYTSGSVVDAWIASPGHKANIMNDTYSDIGIAVMNGKLAGKDTTLVVQMFGKPLSGVPKPALDLAKNTNVAAAATAPTRAPQPTRIAATPIEVSQELVLPVSNQPNNGVSVAPQTVSSGASLLAAMLNLTVLQKVYISLLTLLISSFLLDSFLLYRRRLFRFSSHSVTHVVILVLATATVLYSGVGLVG